MACEGAKERREGLIADMAQVRDSLHPGAMVSFLDSIPDEIVSDPRSLLTMFAGYVCTTVDRTAAAVIALAGPCCEDCDEH